MCDVVCGIDQPGPIPPRKLVRTLCPCLHPVQAIGQRKVNRLVITKLKMQAIVVLQRPPIAPKQGIPTDQIKRGGDVLAVALGHDQQDFVRHTFVKDREEFSCQIGRSPFARACILITGPEHIPMLFGDI